MCIDLTKEYDEVMEGRAEEDFERQQLEEELKMNSIHRGTKE